MITVYSDEHKYHHGSGELFRGSVVPCVENPDRVDEILSRIRTIGLGDVRPAHDFGLSPVYRVHTERFIAFLQSAFDQWKSISDHPDALPSAWPSHRSPSEEPLSINGWLGYFSFDAGTPITAGTWRAASAAANTALTAQEIVGEGAPAAFALTRPPGHHASSEQYGGYCFLNNAAIATEAMLHDGADRVAIFDVDYHHGNGTQAVFYDRSDVLFISIHADPAQEYPFYYGYAQETGNESGEGFNVNYPLPIGTSWERYREALDDGLRRISAFGPDALVVSLGVDTFDGDPLGKFRLTSDNFTEIGRRISELSTPTLFILEGGYDLETIGINVTNVLCGFEE